MLVVWSSTKDSTGSRHQRRASMTTNRPNCAKWALPLVELIRIMDERKDGHYEYIATYVDDLLVWSRDCDTIIDEIKTNYILKGVGAPDC